MAASPGLDLDHEIAVVIGQLARRVVELAEERAVGRGGELAAFTFSDHDKPRAFEPGCPSVI
jgi:hypothetical protein